MKRMHLSAGLAALAMAASSAAWAGPAHVLASQVLTPTPADATYAVSPDLDADTRRALTQALEQAGLRTVPAQTPHSHLITVRAGARALCTAGCSSLLGHDASPLDDFYRHQAVVTAEAETGSRLDAATPISWYTLLQSDGLSNRTKDYLPALLRYGARAYGRETASEAPPKLSHTPYRLPQLTSSPGL